MSGPAMTPWMTARVGARLLLLQARWDPARMQGSGFAFALEPWLAVCWAAEPEALLEARRRHLEYFNTHPYMAAALIGASIPLEAQVSRGERRPDEVTSFKNGIMGSYGAIGDSFFWAALKPLGGVAAVALILAGAGGFGPLAFVPGSVRTCSRLARMGRTWSAGTRCHRSPLARAMSPYSMSSS